MTTDNDMLFDYDPCTMNTHECSTLASCNQAPSTESDNFICYYMLFIPHLCNHKHCFCVQIRAKTVFLRGFVTVIVEPVQHGNILEIPARPE